MNLLAINWSNVGLQAGQLLLALSLLVILHEFGHYIQSRIFGPTWLPLFGMPSILNATFGKGYYTLKDYENSLYTEWSAGKFGRKYW